MRFLVLTIGLLSPFVWAVGACAESFETSTGFSHELERLSDDSPRVRREARDHVLTLAAKATPRQLDWLLSELAMQTLTVSFHQDQLEQRLQLEALTQRVQLARRQSQVEALVNRSSGETIPIDSDLADSWRRYSQRTQTRRDAGVIYTDVILSDRVRGQRRWIRQLGWLAPESPSLYLPNSQAVYRSLNDWQLVRLTRHTATSESRVLSQLIDDLVSRNPYGWTHTQRLGTALNYERWNAVDQLCRDILSAERIPPRELAGALLASLRSITLDPIDVANRFLDDTRCLAVQPGHAIRLHPRNPNRGDLQFDRDVLRTRVQDVAAYCVLQSIGLDPTEHGMTCLIADPGWGVWLSSVGFEDPQQRQTCLQMLNQLLTAP